MQRLLGIDLSNLLQQVYGGLSTTFKQGEHIRQNRKREKKLGFASQILHLLSYRLQNRERSMECDATKGTNHL